MIFWHGHYCQHLNRKPGLVMVGSSYAAAMKGLCPPGIARTSWNGQFVMGMKCVDCGHTTINIR